MDSRERIRKVLHHEEPDRVPVHDTPWDQTIDRWHSEGLPVYLSPAEHFNYEIVSIGCDTGPRFPVETLEKTDEYIISRISTGAVNKNFRDHASTPELVDRPVKKREDWEAIKPRLRPDYKRVDWVEAIQTYQRARSEGKFICYACGYGYDALQGYLRTEQLLMTMVTDPEWVREMVMTHAQLTLDMAEMMIGEGIEFDAFWCFNDMGYRNGLLFSPDAYRRTQKEADRMVFSFFHERGMPVILHSCGRIKELIPDLIEVGLDCLQPLEVKAGMDVRELKAEYGDRLCFMGGIDVRAMAAKDPSVIEEEVRSKVPAAMKGGGYIYHSDHSVPSDVSFERYERAMELVREYGAY